MKQQIFSKFPLHYERNKIDLLVFDDFSIHNCDTHQFIITESQFFQPFSISAHSLVMNTKIWTTRTTEIYSKNEFYIFASAITVA